MQHSTPSSKSKNKVRARTILSWLWQFKLLIVCFLMISILLGFEYYREWQFEKDIGGRIKRATQSNSTLLARMEVEAALEKIEERGLTHGSTHVLFYTPDCDIRFWYRNIKDCQQTLAYTPYNVDTMVRVTQLKGIHQTLLAFPPNIEHAPDVRGWFLLWFLVSVLTIIALARTAC